MYSQTIENVKISGTFIIDDNFDISAQVAIFILVIYINFGAVLFFLSEEWSPLESFYFTYVTLTTIGFGDYVPQVLNSCRATSICRTNAVFCFLAPFSHFDERGLYRFRISAYRLVPKHYTGNALF